VVEAALQAMIQRVVLSWLIAEGMELYCGWNDVVLPLHSLWPNQMTLIAQAQSEYVGQLWMIHQKP
jgi:hypothetical protein